MNLAPLKKNIYSQNGEDGVLEELLSKLNIQNGFAVEFGAWDGILYSNTFHLIRAKRWKGLYIEGDEERFQDLKKNEMVQAGAIKAVNAFIQPQGPHSLEAILTAHSVSKDFDILSIDIDGIDLYVWRSLESFKPKVVVIEINSSIDPTVTRILQNGCLERNFQNMLSIGKEKGYTLVIHTGNMIFVRNDLLPMLPPLPKDPYTLFCTNWLKRKRFWKKPQDFVFWEPNLQTKVYQIKATVEGKELLVSTSRPELLFACRSVLVHPTDQRYTSFHGKKALIPCVKRLVPVLSHPYANPSFASGAIALCSYADSSDVALFKELKLHPLESISVKGKMTQAAGMLAGKPVLEAQKLMIELLKEFNAVIHEEPLEPVQNLANGVLF